MQTRTPSDAETLVEVLTGVGLVAAAALFYFLGRLFDPLALLVFGAILLLSAAYQRARGWHVALSTWLLGGLFTLAGLGLRVFVVAVLRVNWLAIALVLLAIWWIYQTFLAKR